MRGQQFFPRWLPKHRRKMTGFTKNAYYRVVEQDKQGRYWLRSLRIPDSEKARKMADAMQYQRPTIHLHVYVFQSGAYDRIYSLAPGVDPIRARRDMLGRPFSVGF